MKKIEKPSCCGKVVQFLESENARKYVWLCCACGKILGKADEQPSREKFTWVSGRNSLHA